MMNEKTPSNSAPLEGQQPTAKNHQPIIGLVLSGGGARGVAHLGALKVMEECGISPSVISGTSAGALVGALYSAGHSTEVIFEFFKSTAIFSFGNFTARKPGMLDSERFIPILKEYLPEDSFESLHKKLYVTATDIINGKSKTFSSGELIKPLVASAAVPVVFSPVNIDGILYTDGGALNNFPVEPLNGRCDAIIGVSVHPLKEIQAAEIKSTYAVMERIFHLTVFYHSIQKFHQCNLVIAPQALANFGTFNRGSFQEIYQIGYDAALEKKAELEALLHHC